MKFRLIATVLTVLPCILVLLSLIYWSTIVNNIDCTKHFMSTKDTSRVVCPSTTCNVSFRNEFTKHNAIDPKLLELSEHPDIDIRGKFQHTQMKKLCQHYNFPQEQRYPSGDQLIEFNRHLMFDDERKLIYCFVPKVGCTNMKRLMLYMGGHLPLDTIDWPWVEDSIYLEPALKYASFLNKSLSTKDRIERIQTYFKFMIVRNPLERLLSAYCNKIEPLLKFGSEHYFPEYIKVEILNKYRHSDLALWKQSSKLNHIANISVTFSEFIRYFIETLDLNEHFAPSMDMCHPCLIGYDFYANFKNLSHDVAQLMKSLHTDPRYYRDRSLHDTDQRTNIKLASYYSLLTHREKVQLLGKLYDELLFYYTIYPSERTSHQKLLAVDVSVF